ncbi:MAG TPA: decarboxylating 6-phosphogluconate dehydrogenase [Gemmatimonadaceae bacterium]|nr:decarboxylating 6-phosphogluconate dehydrogenase [Gemmatimonadaceae bacterium]
MQLAMIGLGRMGGNMVERLMRHGHKLVVFDRSAEAVAKYEKLGATSAADLAKLVQSLEQPRIIWIMVPAGEPVDETIAVLKPLMSAGDIIIDGGNSNFHDTIRRGQELAASTMELIDSGTSGGIWGLENGYCLMVGGSDTAVKHCEPIFTALAPENGYAHVGPTGSGHYVKMVHNGIEYALLQGYAEGYEILHASKIFPKLDLGQISEVWQHGSVVRSWLNELAASAFQKDASLADIKGWVADSGEGRWTVQEAIDLDVPAPIITHSLLARFRSRQTDSFGAKVIAALRNEFGGHAVKKS